MPGCGAKCGAGNATDNGHGLRIERLNVSKIAGRNRLNRGVQVIDDGALHILQLNAVAAPAARRGAMISKGAPGPAVGAHARQHRLEFIRRCMRTIEAQIHYFSDFRRNIFSRESLL